ESFYPGGAANVARNLRELTGEVAVIGMVGDDRSGHQLCDLLADQRIEMLDSGKSRDFRTIVKTRIIARHQQVLRVDREKIVEPSAEEVGRVVATVQKALPGIDGLIFEDYGKGFLKGEMVAAIAREARNAGKIVAADPNPRHMIDWLDMTVVKPNRSE